MLDIASHTTIGYEVRSVTRIVATLSWSRSPYMSITRNILARALTLACGVLVLSLGTVLVPTIGHAQSIESISPDNFMRGRTTRATVTGTDLDLFSGATIDGGNAVVERVIIDDDASARIDITVGDRAVVGSRTLRMVGGTNPVFEDVLTIVAGPVSILTMSEREVARGQTATIQISGKNLDTITSFDFGPGIGVASWQASSPVQGSLQVTVGEEAAAGPRAIIARSTTGDMTQPAAFTVIGGTTTINAITPASGTRGATQDIAISGRNLDTLTSLSFGARIVVTNLTITSPTSASARVEIRDEAFTGPRAATIVASGVTRTFPDAYTVTAGPAHVDLVRPDRVSQGERVELTFQGRNLDRTSALNAGPGIDVVRIEAVQPAAINVVVDVADDAPLGFRDVTLEGPNGTVSMPDAIVVIEAIIPEARILFEPMANVGDTQLGATRRGRARIENAGAVSERVVIGPGTGDRDLLQLIDPATDAPVDTLTFDIAPDDEVFFDIMFTPIVRGTSGAVYPISVRDDQPVGDLQVRGNGITRQLTLGIASPADLGTYAANITVPLPRLDTRFASDNAPTSTEISAIQVRLSRDGAPVDNPGDHINIELTSTIGGDTFFWGTTEVDWSLSAPSGSYSGALIFETTSATAPTIPFRFSFITTSDGEPVDAGDHDAGMPDVGVPDAGDTSPDTSTPDVIAPDTDDPARPDTDTAPSPDTHAPDTDDASPDTPGDTPERSRGCASMEPATPASAVLWLLAGLMLGTSYRRRSKELWS